MSTVTAAVSPALVVKSPLLLIALSPLPRHLAMVAPLTPLAPFFAIAVVRLYVAQPLLYWLGREFGDDAIHYLAGKLGSTGATLLRFDRGARRIAWLLLLIWPSPLVCALAGAAQIRPLLFVLLSLTGTCLMVSAVRLFGESFAGPLLALRAFFEQHTLTATVATTSILLLGFVLQRGRKSAEVKPAVATDEIAPPSG